jgi:hypothetical protein
MVSNTGILAVTAGNGISITGSPSNALISNTGITSVVAGTGLQVTTAGTQATVQNTGVLSVTAGTNVTVMGTPSNPVINCTSSGITNITTDATLATTGGSTPQLSVAYPAGVQTLTFQALNTSGSVQFISVGAFLNMTDMFVPLFGTGGRVGTMHNLLLAAFTTAAVSGYQDFICTNTGFINNILGPNSTVGYTANGLYTFGVNTVFLPSFVLRITGSSPGQFGPISLQILTSN